jgi:hypothetical protein
MAGCRFAQGNSRFEATGGFSKTAHTNCDFCVQTFGPKIQANIRNLGASGH